ncbi:hypothetical protein AURDEDRAFT_126727 [Auricularia subglabra TFB-10046 SS5]|nr:hypothetical protein AURDEDRAFT_126727 [Auricularia subglabra TFB-10046 SS5]
MRVAEARAKDDVGVKLTRIAGRTAFPMETQYAWLYEELPTQLVALDGSEIPEVIDHSLFRVVAGVRSGFRGPFQTFHHLRASGHVLEHALPFDWTSDDGGFMLAISMTAAAGPGGARHPRLRGAWSDAMGRRVLPLLDKLGVPCRPLNGYAFGPLMPGSASSMWQSSFIVKSGSVAPTRLLPLIARHATVTRAPAAAEHLTRRLAIGRSNGRAGRT